MEKEEKNEEPIDTSINAIPICYIDPEGTFKYVQISCNNKIYVRGIAKYKYHKGIYKSFIAELAKFGLDKEYPIDYAHMSFKAKILGKFLLGQHFYIIRFLSKIKQYFNVIV